jgi:hypothetical protein
MKFVLTLIILGCGLAFQAKSQSDFSKNMKFRLDTLGLGWAQNAVNVPVFRKNSLVTFKDIQFTAFYDSIGNLVIAKRKMGDKWETRTSQYKGNVKDAHNSISLMVDGEGYLHVSWDHHSSKLRYCRGIAPFSIELGNEIPMIGQNEEQVTYPEFYALPNGDLLFLIRQGVSGRGDLALNRYSVKTKTWARVQNILIDGEGKRNAYWQACTDERGGLHLSWVWRETSDVATNHDLCYAYSKDGGKNWQKSSGEKYTLPIKAENAEYICKIPQKSELINQTSMYADAKGRAYIASYWRDSTSTVPQYRLVYTDGKTWKNVQVSDRKTPFTLGGWGTKRIPVSRPQVIVDEQGKSTKVFVIFRDEERGNKASISYTPDLSKNQWTTTDLTNFSLGFWEPSFDTELWKKRKKLSLFLQNVGQGDGEKLENLPPTPVIILTNF